MVVKRWFVQCHKVVTSEMLMTGTLSHLCVTPAVLMWCVNGWQVCTCISGCDTEDNWRWPMPCRTHTSWRHDAQVRYVRHFLCLCCTVCVIISDQVVSEFSILLAFFAAMVSCIVFFSYCQQIDKVVNEFLLNFGRGFTLGHETRYRIGCFS